MQAGPPFLQHSDAPFHHISCACMGSIKALLRATGRCEIGCHEPISQCVSGVAKEDSLVSPGFKIFTHLGMAEYVAVVLRSRPFDYAICDPQVGITDYLSIYAVVPFPIYIVRFVF